MKKVYLASGWFNPEQERRVSSTETILRELGLEVFSPREHSHEEFELMSSEWRKVTFKSDVDHIDWADVLVAVYDEEDAGTMWEIGYAYATGKPIVIFHETNSMINLMISDSLRAYLTSFEDIKNYDFNTLPAIPYVGEVQ